MKIIKNILNIALLVVPVVSSFAAVTAEEAKQLGDKLTPWGAEKAGNAAGTIPAWTGVPKPPADFKPGSGVYPDPFAGDKPLFSITAANMQQYANQLSEGNKELFKRYPATYRMDVYPARRTYDQPADVSASCLKNAVNAKTVDSGVTVEGAYNCIPFPIPKTGNEVMWNHLTPWRGRGYHNIWNAHYVDSTGRAILTNSVEMRAIFPLYTPGKSAEWLKKEAGNVIFSTLQLYKGPPRSVGEGVNTKYTFDPLVNPNRIFAYQPGQRRVRATPDTFYDFPVSSLGGAVVYDDVQLFLGAQDRFDFKLIGKKEMFVIDNMYKFISGPADKLLTKNHLNPDYVRWELHRVWVVESTLKPEFRHIYSKRIFYFDEDNAGVGLSDAFDMAGKLYRHSWEGSIMLYDTADKVPFSSSFGSYDFNTGVYLMGMNPTDKGWIHNDPNPDPKVFTPQNLQSQLQR